MHIKNGYADIDRHMKRREIIDKLNYVLSWVRIFKSRATVDRGVSTLFFLTCCTHIYVNAINLISHLLSEIEIILRDILHDIQDYANSKICSFYSVYIHI